MTKSQLIEAMAGLADDTIIEIHVPADTETGADYEVGTVGAVNGARNPSWFNISLGDFITECE